ncbi:hypothetical protein DPX16_7228 [Anabarilius grahami]|uniref:Uncharacterized protein n=1 Tax=Anabarilius grahami TaxID=495550 RepID=A0A3N0XMS5_ANAGA|nr:hypothetical protein DPX16_7228 [Anabarilius grahami]
MGAGGETLADSSPSRSLAPQSPEASGRSPQSHGFHSDFAVLTYRMETKTELVSRHHSAHSDTLGQVNQEAGQDTTDPQREATTRSKVPLHVQGQVVRPGETPGERNSKRKGEKQGQAGATEAIKCDQSVHCVTG